MTARVDDPVQEIPIGTLGWIALLSLTIGLGNVLGAYFTLPTGFLFGQCTCGAPAWAPVWMIGIYALFVLGAGTMIAELLRLRKLRRNAAVARERRLEGRQVWDPPEGSR